jgi:hypothetical protein
MKDARLARVGVAGYNKPKRTPSHPTKSHVVVAKQGDQVKTIRFGQQGVTGSQKKEDESRYKIILIHAFVAVFYILRK